MIEVYVIACCAWYLADVLSWRMFHFSFSTSLLFYLMRFPTFERVLLLPLLFKTLFHPSLPCPSYTTDIMPKYRTTGDVLHPPKGYIIVTLFSPLIEPKQRNCQNRVPGSPRKRKRNPKRMNWKLYPKGNFIQNPKQSLALGTNSKQTPRKP